eukprot:6212931-Pleurochrysis_carterae.AAC.1
MARMAEEREEDDESEFDVRSLGAREGEPACDESRCEADERSEGDGGWEEVGELDGHVLDDGEKGRVLVVRRLVDEGEEDVEKDDGEGVVEGRLAEDEVVEGRLGVGGGEDGEGGDG